MKPLYHVLLLALTFSLCAEESLLTKSFVAAVALVLGYQYVYKPWMIECLPLIHEQNVENLGSDTQAFRVSNDIRNLWITNSGSGAIILYAEHQLDEIHVSLTGSGLIDLMNVVSCKVNVALRGSGSAHVNVADRLNYNIQGSGSIIYKGTVRSLFNNKYNEGSGSLRWHIPIVDDLKLCLGL